ncbi:uncharacterized protein LOC122247911 isoform X3 [Penaeus japonicus]|uniref:uncharacterized protein LOC122247911 isoform X3 n=1 Tax=Penaeus japonicus TaxID=27405 RepID=UPI001C7151F2|nr:uncharacterized protein LOC122247911 isoform X3 [Penaeus japonicus]
MSTLNLHGSGWPLVALVVVLSLRPAVCDYERNGKLSSGSIFGGHSYQHILVEEAEQGGGHDHGRYTDGHSGNKWYWDDSGDSCYELVKTRSRIDPRYIIRGKVLRTRDRRECEQECDREYDCRGFNYRFKTIGYDQYRDNCELSSEGAGNRYDFLTDDDFDFYEKSRNCRNNGNNNYGNNNYGNNNYGNNNYGNNNYGNNNYGFRDECFRLAKIETTIERPRDRVDVRDIRECEDECKRTRRFTCRSFAFRTSSEREGASDDRYSSGGTWARDNCYLSDREFRELNTYELLHDRSFDFYERRLYDRECGIDDHNHDHHDNQGEGGDMTVNGIQCYRGRCREDREGGYWYCHTDFSEAWDYCCRPREVCGYSQGYEQKWCYVGSEGRDQWRPCKGQGRDRDYLKEEGPPMSAEATTLEPFMNLTSLEVLDLNDLTI